jgi:hypothetical protein
VTVGWKENIIKKIYDILEKNDTFEEYRDSLIPVYQEAVDFWNSRK